MMIIVNIILPVFKGTNSMEYGKEYLDKCI